MKNLLKELKLNFSEGLISLTASSLAYTTLLSIIPLLAVTFAILKRFGDIDRLYGKLEPLIISNLATGTGDQVVSLVQKFVNNTHASAIGLTGFVGLAITSWFMLSSVEDAFNRIWTGSETRPLYVKVLIYSIFIALGPFVASLLAGLTRSSYLISELVAVASFTLAYKLIPNTYVGWQYAFLSGAFSSVFLQLARWGYQIYTTRYVSYHRIYGSLAAIPILLLWVYILWVIILTGAVLGAGMQKYFRKRSEQPPTIS